jgi:hypothetical protein
MPVVLFAAAFPYLQKRLGVVNEQVSHTISDQVIVVVFLGPILALCWEECVVTCYYADNSSVIKRAERMILGVGMIMEMYLNVNNAVLLIYASSCRQELHWC